MSPKRRRQSGKAKRAARRAQKTLRVARRRAWRARWVKRFRTAHKAAHATHKATKFVSAKARARHTARAQGRADAADPSRISVVGDVRPNRRPDGAAAFVPKRHGQRRWYSRNIHFAADGSITTTPTVAYTWWGRVFAASFDQARDRFIRSAQRRADNDARLGRPRDRVERQERKIVLRRERRSGGGKFTCRDCPPPLNQFRSATELNEHFRAVHLDDDAAGRATGEGAARGMPQQSRPRHRAQTGGRHRPVGPTMPDTPTRPRVYLVDNTPGTDPVATAREPHFIKITEAVMSNGTGLSAQVAEWGEHIPDGVGAMREDFAEIQQLGNAFAEAIQTKVNNLRTGAGPLNGRPIAEEVLAVIERMVGAAEDISKAGTEGAQTFEDVYDADIRRALAKDRPEDEWLEKTG